MIITIKYRRSTGRKKLFPQCIDNSGPEMKPNVLETLSIGRGRSIALIQVGNKRLLIGSTPRAINRLKSFPEPISPGWENINAQSQNVAGKDNEKFVGNLFEVKKESPV